jgi:MFS family permease
MSQSLDTESPDRPRALLKDQNFLILLALSTMTVMAGAVIAPILPDLLEPLKTDGAWIGFVATTHSLLIALGSPLMGVLSDRLGRLRVLVPSCILYAVAGSVGGLVSSLGAMLVTRALLGIGIAGVAGVVIASVGDLYDGSRRAEAMGYQAAARTLGGLFFPLIGGLLGLLSWRYPFFVYATGIPFAFIAWKSLKDLPQPDQAAPVGPYLQALARLVATPRLAVLCGANAAFFALLYGMIIYMPLLLKGRGQGSSAVFGLMVAIQAAFGAVAAARAGWIMARWRWASVVALCFVIDGVMLALVPLMPGPVSVTLTMMLFGPAIAVAVPILTTWVTELTPPELRGGSLSVFTTTTYLGQFLAPVGFGWIVKAGSLPMVFVVGGAVALAAGGGLWARGVWLEETLEQP